MDFELKPLSIKAIPEALEKVERYRLLNEPKEAESICLDILNAEPGNQKALIWLILSLTDQFNEGITDGVDRARELLPQLKNDYDRLYYRGLIFERQGKALLQRGMPGTSHAAYEWFREAMLHFEEAEKLRPTSNEDAILRWNTCARIIMSEKLEPRPDDEFEPYLE